MAKNKDAREPRRPSDPFERFAWPILLIFGAAVLAVYGLTLYPSVPGGDSGELIVASYSLGVAHPPGYPLYTLLGKLATWIGVGSVAWRVNLLTAVLGAAAATLLLRAAWRLHGCLGTGILVGGLFAFSPLVWRYAIGAEVFALNNLFIASLVAIAVAYAEQPADRGLYVFAFVFGLGLTNHHTLLFFGAPLLIWMLIRAGGSPLAWPRLARIAGLGAVGLSPYLYLLLSPAGDPTTTWRRPDSPGAFLEHVLREQYGTFRLGASEASGSLFANVGAYLASLPGEMLYVGVLLPFVAIAVPAVRRSLAPAQRTLILLWLVLLAVYLLVFNSLANLPLDDPLYREIQSRFWQQPNLILFLLAGSGFFWLVRTRSGQAAAVAVAAALAAVGVQVGVNFANEDQSDNRLISDYAEAVMEQLPRDAIVIGKGDLYWNSMRYKQVCEQIRPDLRLLDIEVLKAPWTHELVAASGRGVELPAAMYRAPARSRTDSYDLLGLIRANAERAPVLTNALGHDGDDSWKQAYGAWPLGPFDRMAPLRQAVDPASYAASAERWLAEVSFSRPARLPAGSWEAVAWREYLGSRSRAGNQLLNHVVNRGLERRHLRRAGAILESAVADGEQHAPPVWLNLGIYYFLERGHDPDAVPKLVQAWETYLDLSPEESAQTRLVREVLKDPAGAQIKIGAY